MRKGKQYKEIGLNKIMRKEDQVDINFIVGLVIIMVGTLSVMFMGLGFIFNNPNLIWVGSVVLGVVSVVAAILEKVLIK